MDRQQCLEPQSGDALLVVDVQNDFLPGGALAVPGGDQVIAPLNQVISHFQHLQLPIFFSRDWHPPNHCSFQSQGGEWPEHCVQGESGAEFVNRLTVPREVVVISKATKMNKDAYSAFEDTDLAEQLWSKEVTRLWVGGLATDYCVLSSVLDAIRQKFVVVVLVDAIAAVNLHPDDGELALKKMVHAGARLISSEEVCGVSTG